MPPVPTTPPVNFAAGVIGTDGKFATGDNDRQQIAPSIKDIGGKFATCQGH